MKEYSLQYQVKFKCNNKNLETIKEVRSLGSTISPMEFCMILDDRLKEFKLICENIKSISYNYNKEDKILVEQVISSDKRIYKETLDKIREGFLNQVNTYFKKHIFHTFNKDGKRYEMFIEFI